MITLPANFEADIQGQNLNLFPLVTIGNYGGTERFVSTKDITVDDRHFKPLLLNIPSIKESMDFENRNYKISNVTLKISNYEYGGERFSDYVGNLINESVRIFWKSQSSTKLHYVDLGSTYDANSCPLVYKGFIRRYSHDDEQCTLQLEDSTQRDLHKDVPVARLGDGDEILNKYKNSIIPMCYGHVDKSPCVMSNFPITDEFLNGEFYILCDNLITGVSDAPLKTIHGLNEEDHLTLPSELDPALPSFHGNPLYVFKSDSYLTVKEKTLTQPGGIPLFDYNETDQYFVEEDNSIRMVAMDNGVADQNPVAVNNLICHYYKRPMNFKLYGSDDLGGAENPYLQNIYVGDMSDIQNINDNNIGTYASLDALLAALQGSSGSSFTYRHYTQFDLIFEPFSGIFEEQEFVEFYSKTEFTLNSLSDVGFDHKVYFFPYLDSNTFPTESSWFTTAMSMPRVYMFDSITNTSTASSDNDPITETPSGHWDFDILSSKVPIAAKATYVPGTANSLFSEDITIKLYDAFIKHHALIDGIKNADYYLDVNGRTDNAGVYE